MSDTPRTDAVWKAWTTDDPDCDRIAFMSEHANTLERENTALREQLKESDAKGKAALEEAAKVCESSGKRYEWLAAKIRALRGRQPL